MAVSQIQALPRKLWEHPDPKSTEMYKFLQKVNSKHALHLKVRAANPPISSTIGWQRYVEFSVERRSDFWSMLFDDANLIHEGTYRRVVDETLPIDAVPRWFDGVRLNFAENMLYTRSRAPGASPSATTTIGKEDDRIAVTEVREGAALEHTSHVTWSELRRRAAQLAAAMAAHAGVKRGDRVVVVGANSVETLLVWLATCWLGGLFSSSSTDMGARGILQRTVQVNPKLLFMDDVAVYNGKTTDLRPKMKQVVSGLRAECSAFAGAVAIPRFTDPRDVTDLDATRWVDFVGAAVDLPSPPFARVDFADPFLICFSSGTTGTPKAIVHSVGGLLINYYKEAILHEGMSPDSVTMQFTTVGWIMYIATVGVLVFGCRTVLYDGSPFQPDPAVLVRLAARERVTKLGLSPRWMLEMVRHNIAPRDIADLSALRVVTCTGMVLSQELQNWFYDTGFGPKVHLANISGGTDIAGCFGICNPLTPVYVGGAQGQSLGVDVRLFDTTSDVESKDSAYFKGVQVPSGEPGELVAVKAFPNIPCFFWNDKGSGRVEMDAKGTMVLRTDRAAAPEGSRYHDAYFGRFRHVWAHGDFCSIHPVTGALDFLGRADGVLNPSGVRFGSAEVYAVLERNFSDRVADSLCVGQRRPGRDADESVLLFLLMRPGQILDAKLETDVRGAIARDLSKRHVPRYIFTTPAIPTTINMKKVELPVKRIVSGERITPSGTLANPESLDYFYPFAEIEQVVGKQSKAKL
ncbi:acetoacetyl-CoA synthetase [Sporothrix schenckii 1099-18]|uniref:Acetoacetyl-CoA synthetase n=1 Tax=Sporothrix schenckii 1099-18 TaxID=1397361 RepID=A0A0F2LZV9_SPOSC|nr:acetoacetyl-CoA synthetase [Sporothrix schenckii 1099-18]KJR82982.1 acetoacetyl-CoA synthetase [Sporothrix schenckii 1099-18]